MLDKEGPLSDKLTGLRFSEDLDRRKEAALERRELISRKSDQLREEVAEAMFLFSKRADRLSARDYAERDNTYSLDKWRMAFNSTTDPVERVLLIRKLPIASCPDETFSVLFGEDGVFAQTEKMTQQTLEHFYDEDAYDPINLAAEYHAFETVFSTIAEYRKSFIPSHILPSGEDKKTRTIPDTISKKFLAAFSERLLSRMKTIPGPLFDYKRHSAYPASAFADDAHWERIGVSHPKSDFMVLVHDVLWKIPEIFDDKKEGIELILSIVEACNDPDIAAVAARFSSRMDPHLAAEMILPKIRDVNQSKEQKKRYGEILHLLELKKKIPVTEQTLEYLRKKYHLKGDLADKAVAAIRIDDKGKLALLNAEDKVIGYITFGNFESEEEEEAVIKEFSTELFLLRADTDEKELPAEDLSEKEGGLPRGTDRKDLAERIIEVLDHQGKLTVTFT